MSGKSYKSINCKSSVSACLEQGVSALVELGEECRASADNFENQDHPKAQAFSEAADALENQSLDVDLPDAPAELEVPYTERVPRRRRHNPSRASRCSNAIASLQAGLEAMQEWSEANPDHDKRDEVDSLCVDVENLISEAEGVEFPGLYG